MYLKKIEVNGFKSFANKVPFEFDNGITGIVGPNGSGKSNIADAVRWVLGEQSPKQLRGSNMQDVIFAGTETRKPVSYASVALTIDNSDHALDIDYDEVTVARRVFRSGESEYLLNGTACRLKDIHELFYDTGIGKEGYSIIGQGQIDRILSGKPDERRELFDEAAGIVKFKKRKNSAVKSLENERDNLVRIDDILGELERQVGPLSRQSEKAKTYLSLKESLKKYEVNLFLIENANMRMEMKAVTDKLDIVDAQFESAKAHFESIKSQYADQEAVLTQTSTELEELIAKNNQGILDRQKLESQVVLLEEQIRSVNKTDATFQERIASIREQIEDREAEKSELMKNKFSMDEEIDEALANNREADEAVSEMNNRINALMEEIEQKKNDTLERMNRRGAVKAMIERNETLLEQIQIRKAELTRKILDFKTDASEFDTGISRFKRELNAFDTQLQTLNKELTSFEQEISQTRQSRNENRERYNAVKEQNMRASSRLETLKNIAERYDGYGNSIRKVMDEKERNAGILGVVADLISSEKKYEVAIETALGGTIQNIVTDTEATAKAMIQFLKRNQYGRATFLPLDAIRSKGHKEEGVRREAGVIGFASELVTTEARYKNLSEYLLGRCVVCDNIDHAIALNKKFSYSLKIVTLEGELLNAGGSMTGGAFRNQSNLLGRRREIEELEELIQKTSKNLSSLENTIREQGETIASATERIAALTDEIQSVKIKRNTVQINYDTLNEKQASLNSVYENNHKEELNIENQLREIKEQLTNLRKELVTLDEEDTSSTARVAKANEEVEALKKELVTLMDRAEKAHIVYSQVSQRAGFAEENVKRVLSEITRLKESIEDLMEGKSDNEKEINEKNSHIEQIQDTIRFATETLSEYEIKISELRQKKDELTETMKGFFASRESCQDEVVALEKEQMRLVAAKEKLESGMDSRIEYMWDEYEITLSQAAELRDESLDDDPDIKAKVSDLRGQIKRLGDVNVNAIEEYKEVAERYEFLKQQHDDLVEGRDKLIAVIEELDKGMRERFTETFEQIRIEYDKVFKQLFGGGKGTIEINEEQDILEADISIISQPPGKKLQNMMQLSGGEKALSAICLLFAIQNLKPSPFCLLDEIEAALDDSNVDRYAKYLHKLTNHTQFIVITHRRGTMASADRLYGITMQEKGVSALVSVDLVEKELDQPKV